MSFRVALAQEDVMSNYGKYVSRGLLGAVLLILPVGYYEDGPDSSFLTFGVHGGGGQVSSVIRDCEGNTLHSSSTPFFDVSAFAKLHLPTRDSSPLSLGVRAGYWEAELRSALGARLGMVKLSYFNPQFDYEFKYIGFGLGYISNGMPFRFDDLRIGDFDGDPPDFLRVSGHFRAGNIEKTHFKMCLAENMPLYALGVFDFGVGYPAGGSTLGYTALTFGYYDGLGFLHKMKIGLTPRLRLDVGVRAGVSGERFEGAAVLGLAYRIGSTHQETSDH
jgi:hypothetical protein